MPLEKHQIHTTSLDVNIHGQPANDSGPPAPTPGFEGKNPVLYILEDVIAATDRPLTTREWLSLALTKQNEKIHDRTRQLIDLFERLQKIFEPLNRMLQFQEKIQQQARLNDIDLNKIDELKEQEDPDLVRSKFFVALPFKIAALPNPLIEETSEERAIRISTPESLSTSLASLQESIEELHNHIMNDLSPEIETTTAQLREEYDKLNEFIAHCRNIDGTYRFECAGQMHLIRVTENAERMFHNLKVKVEQTLNIKAREVALSEFALIASTGIKEGIERLKSFKESPEKIIVKLETVDLKEKLESRFVPAARATLRESDIELKVDIAPDVIDSTDINLLLEVLENLLSNSKKFRKSEGEAIASLLVKKGEDGNIIIRYSDNGVGMNSKKAANIFLHENEPTLSTDGKVQGSGIGLFYCGKIITALGGNIRCVSHEGKETSFSIVLPGTKSQKKSISRKTPSAAPSEGDFLLTGTG